MSTNDILNKEELGQIKSWLDEEQNQVPEPVASHLQRLLKVYLNLSQSSKKAKQTLMLLRQAMGLVPKSEKGGSKSNLKVPEKAPEVLDFSGLSEEQLEAIEELRRKRNELLKEKSGYDKQLKKLMPKKKCAEQLEFTFADELVFSTALSSRNSETSKAKVERVEEFGKERGLHSTFDSVKRIDLNIVVTETTHEVETVTDFSTGKSVRASMAAVGPEGFQITWRAIANLIKMHVGFAIPINRIEMMVGQKEFTSGKICRILEYIATQLLPIYMCLFEDLSDAEMLSGDDTSTKVLELVQLPQMQESLAFVVDTTLGFAQPRADGKGEKKALNVSLLVGRSKKVDPRSTIRFFRTHMGSVGNLLDKVLESRSPKKRELIFQGDLSTTNLPSEELRKQFSVLVAGCGAHARRPFWRYREEDEGFCYFMLRGFWILSYIEKLIDSHGRSEKKILRYRKRYALKVWSILRRRCIAVTTGELTGRYTYRKWTEPQIWPPGTELYKAAQYVIKHFDELTLYTTNAHLQYTNNGSERALRIEKCMLSSSKFRKTRNGRAVLDVLRTINATCAAAKIEIADYLVYVFKHRHEIKDQPEKFTPYAVALKIGSN